MILGYLKKYALSKISFKSIDLSLSYGFASNKKSIASLAMLFYAVRTTKRANAIQQIVGFYVFYFH